MQDKLSQTGHGVGIFALWGVIAAMACAGDGAAVLERFDANGSGTLEVSEMPPGLARRMAALDLDKNGLLDATELGPVADRMARGDGAGKRGDAMRRPGEVNAPAARGERPAEVLQTGDAAPDFTLPLADESGSLTLSERYAEKPVVLVFGSLTCPPFRSRMLEFDPIYQSYKDRVEFIMVYLREAHPESTIYLQREGGEVLETIVQTDDMAQRMDYAKVCGPTLKFSFPTVVDGIDNRVRDAYAGWPSRFVVVDREGKVAFDGGPGPHGFKPSELEAWLAANL